MQLTMTQQNDPSEPLYLIYGSLFWSVDYANSAINCHYTMTVSAHSFYKYHWIDAI